MANVSYKLKDLDKRVIRIGYVGENDHMHVLIDCKEAFDEYPDAAVTMAVTPPEGVSYPKIVTRTGNVVEWLVKDSDVAAEGDGEFQLTFTENSVVKKSVTGRFEVCRSIVGNGPAPDPVEDWLDEANDVLDEAEEAAQSAGSAAEAATAAAGAIDGMTVAASGLAAGEDPTVQISEVSGHKHIAFGIPQGAKGDPGDPGDPSTIIDDTSTAANKVWSASKSGELMSAFNGLDTNAVKYVATRTFHVGDNLLTNDTTFTGTGWSGSLANGFTHATGNTDPLVFEIATEANNAYIIDFYFTGDIGGDNMFVTIGNMPKVDVYHGVIRPFVGIISDGGYLKIYVKSTYTGTITNLKIRKVLESGGTELTFECAEITNGQNPNEISSWHIVAIGRDVLSKNVNGTRTVAIGDRALEKIVTGHRNIAIGPYAMPFVTEGDCNVSIGADTLYNPAYNTGESKAYSNVAIGKGTMLNGQLVQNNIAIGHGAMAANDINAEENVCIGRQCGYNTKAGNTFIGHRAGYYYNGDTGINNVCIGRNAGFNAYHNGQNNVYIGAEARAVVPGASASSQKVCSNSIAIGKGAYVTGSFQIVIGNQNYTTVKIAGKTLKFNDDGTVTWE